MSKICTDLDQSKKLAEILPLESADTFYKRSIGDSCNWELNCKNLFELKHHPAGVCFLLKKKLIVPAWSLAALLDALPKGEGVDADLCFGGYKGNEYINEWFCSYEVYDNHDIDIQITHADNPVDACYEMILRLNKEGLL